ncbi:hypothetical protein Ae168Ps1_0690 [Pseudonocardia sp. Ae168_Ps1]|nr:hypothetical protein Ae150APs1_0691 [Pseudonocardia sp. Ae150A_Ps1]OLL78284.1 hypothetical protein Ae168Ps1_0690 [Pseudonocardia sp. Ae168_Ps1]OLL87589.1 hypothetical protein Ae263Ps1_4644c [Pseudonocardia sp. Ae263_Ps1]OLL92381.1 hypothetical protein Ae356Ps1_2278 [Pseudonocardia sp. Ae356_Ps1]
MFTFLTFDVRSAPRENPCGSRGRRADLQHLDRHHEGLSAE